ncbi:TPA: hypothetical protein ACTZ3T_002828 [Bacillus cereus]|uniref:hypothetical protein n=1 Tax=Bacillus cereus TaxID=1396 RepID=UPI0030189DB9
MSNNLWGDLKNLKSVNNPLDILKEQSGYLMDATDNIIYAEIRNRESKVFLGEPECEFVTIYSLKSKMLEKYEFELLTLFYGITFYPMTIELDENIAENLGIVGYVVVQNEQEFIDLLKKSLDNDLTKNIISSIYAMSK